jgi:outer membrane protein assembly factor BamB
MAVANKGGWLYIYDRASHELIARSEVSTHENTEVPLSVVGVHHCPGLSGGVEWNGPTYSPKQKLIYVNSVDWCAKTRVVEGRYVEGSLYLGGEYTFDPVESAKGWTKALNASTGKEVWSRESRTPMIAGLTPTAGGVVFTGDLDGNFLVLNAASGAVLYRFNTGGAVAGGASTYLIDGKQYVAITSGNASRSTWMTTGAATVVIFTIAAK